MRRIEESSRPGQQAAGEENAALIVRAARRQAVERTPVWFMRQAGRSLPEYRKVRERHDLLAICRSPELCAEVTLQPVRRLGVDGAVLFADITLPVIFGLGVDVRLVEEVGPVVDAPIRIRTDVDRLRSTPAEEAVPFVLETIRILRRELPAEVALIGFSGAPFTLAGYLVEGGPSRDFLKVKTMMYAQPDVWHALMGRLSRMVIDYLRAQVRAGADVVQLFDSWVGTLSLDDYRTYVLPHVLPIFDGLRAAGVPAIHFGTGTAGLLRALRDAGGDVIGLDWRVELGQAWKEEVGWDRGVQGNLDPAALLGPWSVVQRKAQSILDAAQGRPGHIFNLGHGVLPDTPVAQLQRLVEWVHGYRRLAEVS